MYFKCSYIKHYSILVDHIDFIALEQNKEGIVRNNVNLFWLIGYILNMFFLKIFCA